MYEAIDRTEYDLSFWESLSPGAMWRESMRIAEQNQALEEEHGITPEEVRAWEENFEPGNYEGLPEDPGEDATPQEQQEYEEQLARYMDQPVEEDARQAPYSE